MKKTINNNSAYVKRQRQLSAARAAVLSQIKVWQRKIDPATGEISMEVSIAIGLKQMEAESLRMQMLRG